MLRIIILILLLTPLASCSETKSEIIARLSKKISEINNLSVRIHARNGSSGSDKAEDSTMRAPTPLWFKETDKIQGEIEQRLRTLHKKKSKLLSKYYSKRILRPSWDGSTLIWQEGKKFYYRRQNMQTSFELDSKSEVLDLNPSWSGTYVVTLMRTSSKKSKKKKCQARVVSLKTERILKQTPPEINCDHIPAISDDGNILYHANGKGGLTRFPILASPTILEDIESNKTNDLSKKNFSFKYKHISDRFVLYPIGQQSLLVFHGNAGYYRMYFFRGAGKEKIKRYKEVFASPRLYTASAFATPLSESIPSLGRQLGLYSANAFVYSGSAGKLKLHALHYDGSLLLNKGMDANVVDNLAFLQDLDAFLMVKEGNLYTWDPLSKQKRLIPLDMKYFVLMNEGITYTDKDDNLYLRRKSFSEFELTLMRLHHELLEIKENLFNKEI